MELNPIKETAAEEAYLGNILVAGGKYISRLLSPEDFYRPIHQQIYKAILEQSSKGEEIDPVLIARKGKDFFSEISRLSDAAMAPSSNYAYAKVINGAAKKRALRTMALDLAKLVESGDNVEELADKAIAEISALSASSAGVEHGLDNDDILTSVDLAFHYDAHIESLKQGGVHLGIPVLDGIIRRIAKGEVLTLLARPGCYKTALLQHAMLRYDKTNEVSIFFSLEMPPAGIYERFAQSILGRTGYDFERAWGNSLIGQTDLTLINNAMAGIYIIPTRPTIAQMKYYCNRVEKKSGKPVGFVGIDYLGLVSDAGKSEYERNSKIAVDVKMFAKQQNVSVMLLSQLNRTAGDGTTPVTLDMARGSGQIEEAADYMVGLHRIVSDVHCGRADIGAGVLKNRTGRVGDEVAFGVYPQTMRFAEVEFQVEEETQNEWDMLTP